MVDIILLLMAIASAISLLVVSPRDLQRKAILALKEYEEMELSHAPGRGEDGQGAIRMNRHLCQSSCRSDLLIVGDQLSMDQIVESITPGWVSKSNFFRENADGANPRRSNQRLFE